MHLRARFFVATALAASLTGTFGLLPGAATARAAGLTMTSQVLLGGHTRLGSWAAISVDIVNDGPAVSGELRLTGGSQGRTRYAAPVDLPTGSHIQKTLYAQPGVFRSTFEIELVASDGTVVTKNSLKVVNHDAWSPLVAVVAERPQGLVPGVTAAMNANPQVQASAVITLAPADLPERVEAWGALDRLVWQDVPVAQLSTGQLDALRGWVAGGGRLVLLGGTSGTGVFAGLREDLLPFRPTATVDLTTDELTSFLGPLPDGATALPALAGILVRGRPLARAGDLVSAALMDYGRGSVTLIGFDPATTWVSTSRVGAVLWRLALPVTTGYGAVNPGILSDDSQLVQALYFLPTLDLPPIDTLVVLLILYTLLIGPLNYLVLKRLDRREWAWITMPALVLVFSVASYGLGLTLHGTDTIVNELSIVRGTAGTDAGRAQVFFGVFSPSRRSFDVEVKGPALVTSTISEYQQTISQAGLDVVQGESARVRGLEVSVADLRAFRGELAVVAPLIEADLRLEGASVRGTVTNRSGRTLERPAVVIGSTVVRLNDLADGQSAQVTARLGGNPYGPSLGEQLFGSASYQPGAARSIYVRRAMIEQLTQGSNKFASSFSGGERPLLVAWGSDPVVPVSLGSERPQQVADTLYLVNLPLRASGTVVLAEPLIGRQIVESDAAWASDEGFAFSLGEGSMTVRYQAIPLDGDLRVTKLVLAMLEGGNFAVPRPVPDPLPPVPPDVAPPPAAGGADAAGGAAAGGGGQPGVGGGQGAPAAVAKPGLQGVPTIELFDRDSGTWVAFEQLAMGQSAEIAEPQRFVDASGGLLVRFGYDDPLDQGGQVYFNCAVSIEGTVQ